MIQYPSEEGSEPGAKIGRIEVGRSCTTHCDVAGRLRGFRIIIKDLFLEGEEIVEGLKYVVDHRKKGRMERRMGAVLLASAVEKNFSNGERATWRKALDGKNLFETFLEGV